jgi:hypothetical protein
MLQFLFSRDVNLDWMNPTPYDRARLMNQTEVLVIVRK